MKEFIYKKLLSLANRFEPSHNEIYSNIPNMKQTYPFINLFNNGSNLSKTNLRQAFTPLYGEPPRRSMEEWIEFYNKNPGMNPVHQIASDVGTSFYGIYNKNDSKKIKLRSHQLEMLLKKPNTDITITEYVLFYITMVYLLLPSGEAFWLKERNQIGKVTELWPIPPNWVLEIPSISKQFFSIYPQGNMQAQPINVPVMDIIYFKKPDVTNPYLRGRGRSEVIGDELETSEFMSKYQKRYFFNDAIPPMVGQMPGADQTVIDRTEEMWQQKYGGFNNSHKVAWLNWDAKIQILKETAKDMDFIESRKYLRDISNQHFSIPPELFGILENSNRSTVDAAYYLYTKNVLRKELKFIDDTLNLQLVPEFGDNIYLEHDNIVPEDDEFLLKKSTEGLKYGALSVNQWLRTNGFEDLGEKGEILYVPLNMIPVPLDGNAIQVNMEPQQQELPPTEQTKPKKKVLTLEQKDQMWYVFDKAAVKNERGFINAMKKYFQDQQDKVNKSIGKSVKQATDNLDELINWDDEDALLVAALSPHWMNSLTEGFTVANDTYGFGISFDLLNPKFLYWINENGLNQAKGINDTTKEKLRKTLSDGIESGEGIPKLRDRVSQVYSDAKATRATLIARTETANTVNYGNFVTMKTGGVKKHSWLATRDGRTRETHSAINGEIVELGKQFSNGLLHPGDINGSASEVCNCRCTTIAEFD